MVRRLSLQVELTEDEYAALGMLAEHNSRLSAEQAHYMIRLALEGYGLLPERQEPTKDDIEQWKREHPRTEAARSER